MTLAEIYRGSEKGFEENYWRHLAEYYPEKERGLFGHIKSDIKALTLAILNAELERVEGEMKDTENIEVPSGENIGEYSFVEGLQREGYNAAIADHAKYIKSQIKLIEEI